MFLRMIVPLETWVMVRWVLDEILARDARRAKNLGYCPRSPGSLGFGRLLLLYSEEPRD